MPINYDSLWKLLIDKKMTKTELRIKANITTSALAKMGKGESVSLEVLERVCLILGCQLSDVAVITRDIEDE